MRYWFLCLENILTLPKNINTNFGIKKINILKNLINARKSETII